MYNPFAPGIDKLQSGIQESKLLTDPMPMRIKPIDETSEIPEFKDMMTGMLSELNNTIKAPDQVMQDVMTGNGADIHDAMIAMSKAELGMSIATSVATKVVQAYEKVIAIQV